MPFVRRVGGGLRREHLPHGLLELALAVNQELAGGDDPVQVRSLVLDSPLASGTATGTIGNAARLASAPLNISLELTVQEAVRGSLTGQGVRVGRDGRLKLARAVQVTLRNGLHALALSAPQTLSREGA